MMRSLLILVLHALTRRVLARHRPLVIGITGSVGKTSTKDLLAAILEHSGKRVGKSAASFNTEIGVPLAVFEIPTSPRRSMIGWTRVIGRALSLAYGSAVYPEILILEMGADHPGDIRALVELIMPTIGIVTAIAPVHLEGFGTMEAVLTEKKQLVTRLPASGTAIISADNTFFGSIRKEIRATTVTVGTIDGCDVRVFEVHPSVAEGSGRENGTFFKLGWKGSVVPCFLPGVLGSAAAQSAGFAAAAAIAIGVRPLEISEALRHAVSPAGRMRVLAGIKGTTLIDDTYNSSPKAVESAMDALGSVTWEGRRIVVLGDMAELGAATDEAHTAVGERIALALPSLFIAVGPAMSRALHAAIANGYPEDRAFHFADAAAAGRFLQERLESRDLVLVKGSQAMRMERVVKELMAEPLRAGELLVRQGTVWK